PHQRLTTPIVVVLGGGLVPPTPVRPTQDVTGRLRHGQDQSPQQPTPLGDAQREERPRPALNAASGLTSRGGHRLFLNASTAIGPARMIVSRANAHMARVIGRYQPVQVRTS